MGNIFNSDFSDFINALNNNNVQYILVGGYSVILHGYSRTTGDMDIWVKKTEDNYKSILKAFNDFKMPVFDMTRHNFLNNSDFNVFTFGKSPVSIDLLTNVKGLDFDEAFNNAIIQKVDDLDIRVVHYNDLLKAKHASARPRDLDDIEHLKKLKE